LVAVFSCQEDEKTVGFGIGTDTVTLGPEGGIEIVSLEAEEGWIANSTVPWIVVSPSNGYGSIDCEVKVDTTLISGDVRRGIVRFTARSGESKDLSVIQTGYDNVISLSSAEVEVPSYEAYGKRYFEVELTSNVPVTVENDAQWLKVADFDLNLDRGSRPRTVKLRIDWESNNRPEERLAEIRFVPASNVELARQDVLKVVQEAAAAIPDSREGDSLAIVGCARSLGFDMGKYEGENMSNWNIVQLWEPTDEGFTEDKRGRVKAVAFSYFYTKDGIPYEIQFLSKLETLVLYSNGNSFLYRFHSGEYLAKLTNLKHFQCFAMGLSELDDDFKNLRNLETLILAANNFDEIPPILTPENFPNLKYLDLAANRVRVLFDMTTTTADKEEWGGLYKNDETNFPTWLLKWENLEYLRLSNNYMQGEIPDMEDYEVRWTEEEVVANDTLPRGNNNPAGYNIIGKPKVLPNAKYFAINLNLYTGKIPEWILYHPHLMEWVPDILVFNQDSETVRADGKTPGFSNIPVSPDYYYDAYPLLKPDYYDQL
ncbi:MAG: hypothetical protein ACI4UJ_09520, partial [Candidatus Cryptobacteroides sp.]